MTYYIYVASWPQARRLVWDTLLRARALENMCYVCGVNRTRNVDGNKLIYIMEAVSSIPLKEKY